MAAGTKNIEIFKGDAVNLHTDMEVDVGVSFTAPVVTWSVAHEDKPEQPVLVKNGIITQVNSSLYQLTVNALSREMKRVGDFVHFLRVSDGQNSQVVLTGSLTVKPAVTD